MDCPSEERLVRMALEPLGSAIVDLKFDLEGRQLVVIHQGDPEPVLEALLPLNFGASLLGSERVDESSEPAQPLADAKPSSDGEARVLRQLLWINAVMFVVEAVFGMVAQSTGLLGDSLDMLADALVYSLSLFAVGGAASKQMRAARLSGLTQMALAVLVLVEVVRKALGGSEPVSLIMIGVSLLALVANVWCVWLLRKHRDGGVHMKASWIFSTNDALVNLGVVAAGVLVYVTHSSVPDLVAGAVISGLVAVSAARILRLSGATRKS